MRLGIIVNPRHARTTYAYAHLVEVLRREKIRYRSATTTRGWPGAQQTNELLDWAADLIIVLGGDGTLRSIAPVLSAAAVPVLIIPTGTANVLSRHIGIRSAEHALRLVESHLRSRPARMCAVPVNTADCLTADGFRREHFLSLAGIGGDARAVAGRTGLPGLMGAELLGYVCGAARALFSPLINAKVEDGGATTVPTAISQVWSVMASKTAKPAGPIPVFPPRRGGRRRVRVPRRHPDHDETRGPPRRVGTDWVGLREPTSKSQPVDVLLARDRSPHQCRRTRSGPARR
ncbi:diacylglycerol/lipid kinase family protein [Brevibacterium marinum]|uniref:DAGKc domain-containing protein n=1 Tax=Brevibacterium marinum TaxID=418643 RepID=A0A846RVI3_9MICO|nr:diacylglycerol kinase family protein [Brevibacterium marinum]NJC57809.1 hypothetical protein [Brevibacterium marinum]